MPYKNKYQKKLWEQMVNEYYAQMNYELGIK